MVADAGGGIAAGEILDHSESDAAGATLEAGDLCAVDHGRRERAAGVEDYYWLAAGLVDSVLWNMARSLRHARVDTISIGYSGICAMAEPAGKSRALWIRHRHADAAGGDVSAADDFSGDDAAVGGAAATCGQVHYLQRGYFDLAGDSVDRAGLRERL